MDRPDAGRGVFDSTLRLDLSSVASIKKARVPSGLLRTLSRINTNVDAVNDLGVLSPGIKFQQDAFSFMDYLTDRMKGMKLNPGLLDIELDNASKIVNASGHSAYAYFMSDKYPWIVGTKGVGYSADVISELIKLLAYVARDIAVDTYRFPNYVSSNTSLSYKKGSSYGLFPYISGRDSRNVMSLLWHSGVAMTLSRAIKRGSDPQEIIDTFREVCTDLSGSGLYMPDIHGHMMIMRARPLSAKKLVPHWRVDRKTLSLSANGYEHGFRAGTREIKPVCASLNLLFTGTAMVFSDIFASIPGLHVGHQVLSPSLMADSINAWGLNNTVLHVEDISAYDNTVSEYHLDPCQRIIGGVMGYDDREYAYLKAMDELPIITAGLFDDGRTEYTRLERKGGIPSGFQGTTVYGTLINFMTKVQIIRDHKKKNALAVLRDCVNLRGFYNRSILDCSWGLLLKGDDIVVFWKKGYLDDGAITDGMTAHGFKTDVEPGPLFLMQYINIRKPMKGGDYKYCPPSLVNVNTLESHGLALKRIGNRYIFVEHPLKDIRPARFAVMANLVDMERHPCYDEYSEYMLSKLSEVDNRTWSEKTLYSYLTSDDAKKEIQDYALTVGSHDSFIKELLRRSNDGDADSSIMSGEDSTKRSSLGAIYDVLLDDIKSAVTLSFGGNADSHRGVVDGATVVITPADVKASLPSPAAMRMLCKSLNDTL